MHFTNPFVSRTGHWYCLLWLAGVLLVTTVRAEVKITLKNDFIADHKLRATITTPFLIDAAPNKPHSHADDGDMHVAGRADKIQLPMVAEIKNADLLPDAVSVVKAYKGTNTPINLTGAWRLWCEHGGSDTFVQGSTVSQATSTNPNHVFEVHPITTIGTANTGGSLIPIPDFSPYAATYAFEKYRNKKFQIIPGSETTTFVTTNIGYNHVEFVLEMLDDVPLVVDDGMFMMARIYDYDEDQANNAGDVADLKCRMVFIKDTPPYEAAKDLEQGQYLHVMGIPRVNLSLVSWRIDHAQDEPDVLNWNLPYEMIIAAVFE